MGRPSRETLLFNLFTFSSENKSPLHFWKEKVCSVLMDRYEKLKQ